MHCHGSSGTKAVASLPKDFFIDCGVNFPLYTLIYEEVVL